MSHLADDANAAPSPRVARESSAGIESDPAAAYKELLHGAGSAVCTLVLGLALLVAIFF